MSLFVLALEPQTPVRFAKCNLIPEYACPLAISIPDAHFKGSRLMVLLAVRRFSYIAAGIDAVCEVVQK